MTNPTIFQFFHWYFPSDGSLWKHASEQAPHLAKYGITHVWLPPAYKSANGEEGVGYDVYDHFDLGEFDQKGSLRTKYGTKEEYLNCIATFHKNGIQVLADIVLNHKQGADEKEKVPVVEVDEKDRTIFSGEQKELELYTKYFFPGRNKKYSEYVWDWQSFSGIDQKEGDKYSIFKIMNQYGPEWNHVIDPELGNFDYLMGADIELRNPYVKDELKWWGKWYCETTNIDGFRLDAVKHMNPEFVIEWLEYLKTELKKDFFTIAEYWSPDANILKEYIDKLQGRSQLMDVPLHGHFHEASIREGDFDIRKLFDETLTMLVPERSITFAGNHDTQPLQTLESKVESWFQPHAYAIILLRLQGMPCIFYPDFYGAKYSDKDQTVELKKVQHLEKFLTIRKDLAYGDQKDYFDQEGMIGWTRLGDDEHPRSGVAVVVSITAEGSIRMEMGEKHSRARFVDVTGNNDGIIETDEAGFGDFSVKAGKVGVYVDEQLALQTGLNR